MGHLQRFTRLAKLCDIWLCHRIHRLLDCHRSRDLGDAVQRKERSLAVPQSKELAS